MIKTPLVIILVTLAVWKYCYVCRHARHGRS